MVSWLFNVLFYLYALHILTKLLRGILDMFDGIKNIMWVIVIGVLLYQASSANAQLSKGYSKLCLNYPKEAADQMADAEWTKTISQLFVSKGWNQGSIFFRQYNDWNDLVGKLKFDCDFNVFITPSSFTPQQLDMLAMHVLFEWECEPMDVTMYYYEQIGDDNKWLATGSTCEVKLCPLSHATLGIGCIVTDPTTFEKMMDASDTMLYMDVPDYVRFKLNTSGTCEILNCRKLGIRQNAVIINSGAQTFIDASFSPTTFPQMNTMLRVNWKKWWQVFYTIVDYINAIVNTMK